MDNTNKDSLKNICDSLAEIGLNEKPKPYGELKQEGWISVEDVAELTNRSNSGARVGLRAAVKSGLWEDAYATSEENKRMTVYREKVS